MTRLVLAAWLLGLATLLAIAGILALRPRVEFDPYAEPEILFI